MTKEHAWLDGEGLHLADDAIAAKVARKPVSATMIDNLVSGCPARYIFESTLKDMVIPLTPDDPRVRGTVFHRACELYYTKPVDTRGESVDPALLQDCAKEALAEQPEDIASAPSLREWLDEACRRYVAMDPSATDVTVSEYRNDKGVFQPALEMVVTGQLPGISRRFYGAIDRLVAADPEHPERVIIDDYKTGRKEQLYSDKLRFPDFNYLRQQTIYAILLERDRRTHATGWRPIGARLVCPMASQVEYFDESTGTAQVRQMNEGATLMLNVRDAGTRRRAMADAAAASDKLDAEVKHNLYEFSPSSLCAWCPLARICPAARITGSEKAQGSFAKQPDAATLAPAIIAA